MNARMQRGQQIAQLGEIKHVSENVWQVPSQSDNGFYEVSKLGETYACTCKDFSYRNHIVGDCKHCIALEYYLKLKAQVVSDIEEQIEQATPEEIKLCPTCQSPSVINYGRRGKRVVKQIMRCSDCGRQFRKQYEAFVRLQSDPRMISLILSMHCRNVSLRGICATLQETYGMKIAPTTVLNYLKRYEKLLSEYMTKCLKPKFSGNVNVDELYVKIDGQMKYLFAALDPNTRYLLCTVLSQKKDYKGARELFRELARAVGHDKKTQTIKSITTDAMSSYKKAFDTYFVNDTKTKTADPPQLIFGAGIKSPVGDNNISERVNNTIRTRERNYRGLKADETPMLPLFVAYYNLIREHQALRKTPAEAAGLKQLGNDKWLELIKKASQWERELKEVA
ncbi:MAG: IS6 family transposase [Nitrososphaera sp.]